MKQDTSSQSGFSAVELLITLFIAALFLIAGFQLYAYVKRNGVEAEQMARASNIAYQNLRTVASNTTYVKTPCSAATQPGSQAIASSTGLNSATVNVVISCPYSTAPQNSVSLLTATVTYQGPSGQETVRHAIFTK